MNALWNLLLEAQTETVCVTRSFLEQKKEELRKARENDNDRRARFDELNSGDRGGRGGGDFRGRERANSTMTMEGTEIVIQDGVTGLVIRAVSVFHLSTTFAYSLT